MVEPISDGIIFSNIDIILCNLEDCLVSRRFSCAGPSARCYPRAHAHNEGLSCARAIIKEEFIGGPRREKEKLLIPLRMKIYHVEQCTN